MLGASWTTILPLDAPHPFNQTRRQEEPRGPQLYQMTLRSPVVSLKHLKEGCQVVDIKFRQNQSGVSKAIIAPNHTQACCQEKYEEIKEEDPSQAMKEHATRKEKADGEKVTLKIQHFPRSPVLCFFETLVHLYNKPVTLSTYGVSYYLQPNASDQYILPHMTGMMEVPQRSHIW